MWLLPLTDLNTATPIISLVLILFVVYYLIYIFFNVKILQYHSSKFHNFINMSVTTVYYDKKISPFKCCHFSVFLLGYYPIFLTSCLQNLARGKDLIKCRNVFRLLRNTQNSASGYIKQKKNKILLIRFYFF